MRAFWLLALLPLVVAGYLAVRVSREGAELRRHELQELLDGRVGEVRSRTRDAMAAFERELSAQLASVPQAADVDGLRAFARRVPTSRQLFRLASDGRLTFPTSRDDASRAEIEFLERTRSIWSGHAILVAGATRSAPAAGEPSRAPREVPGVGDSFVDLAGAQDQGWVSWYWAEGLHLLFWRRAADGGVVGAEVERIALISKIVAALPTDALAQGRMALVDPRGEVVTQWGPLSIAAGAVADAKAPLDAPLDAWQLEYFLSPEQRGALAGGASAGLALGLGAVALAVIGLALYVWREYTRKLRDAASRVGFVTRVSHELRTPLTNIRMYAELLESDALEDDDQARRARVIVEESERLGRLIDNVLAFERHRRGKLVVPAERIEVDVAVRGAVAKFQPALAARSIDVHLDLGAPPPVRAGAGTVDQIVTNLLSNVEKYAPGGAVTVSTRERNGRVVIAVADQGPGVPPAERARIFEPFHRASDSLSEGVSGTGIGLAIARDLARVAGGELALAASTSGARFELTLPLDDGAQEAR